MNDKKLLDIKIGIYGRIQIEMVAVELLDESGVPKRMKRKHVKPHQDDALKIYDSLSNDLRGLSAKELNERATVTNEVAQKLINENQLINNYLLSLMLYRLYIQEFGTQQEVISMLPKVQRLIKIYEELILSEDDKAAEYKAIRQTTARVADNIWRVFTERAQLSDEIRDIRAAKMNIKKGN